MAEERKYLDYDGLAHLVELLTNRIQAVGGDGKYLPLTGGELTGGLTVDGQTALNGDLTLGGSAEINLNGENRISVGGDAQDTFPEFAQDFWDEGYGARLLVVGGGMVHGVSLKELADWIVNEVVGSGGGTVVGISWDVTVRNDDMADTDLAGALTLGMVLGAEDDGKADFDDDIALDFSPVSDLKCDESRDCKGSVAVYLQFGKNEYRYIKGFILRNDGVFVEPNLTLTAGTESAVADDTIEGNSELRGDFAPLDKAIDLLSVVQTGETAVTPSLTGTIWILNAGH